MAKFAFCKGHSGSCEDKGLEKTSRGNPRKTYWELIYEYPKQEMMHQLRGQKLAGVEEKRLKRSLGGKTG